MGILIGTMCFLVLVPVFALAEMHLIETSPTQHCGPACVIDSVAFDTHEEAQAFWDRYESFKGNGGHPPYRVDGCKLWFVDYQSIEE